MPRVFTTDGDVSFIHSTKGFVFVIDTEDLALVSDKSWHTSIRKDGNPYAQCEVRIDGKKTTIPLHRLIARASGEDPEVDHRDGNTLNNRKQNLRPCSASRNQQNGKVKKNNKSGFKGVCLNKGKWRAQIGLGGAPVFLGYFPTPEEAALAYDSAAISNFGEFAKTNFPSNPIQIRVLRDPVFAAVTAWTSE